MVEQHYEYGRGDYGARDCGEDSKHFRSDTIDSVARDDEDQT